MFSFAMTSGLASDSDKFKIIITLRWAQKFGDTVMCRGHGVPEMVTPAMRTTAVWLGFLNLTNMSCSVLPGPRGPKVLRHQMVRWCAGGMEYPRWWHRQWGQQQFCSFFLNLTKYVMFSFAMTSGLASDSDKFKIIITLRRAQKFGDTVMCRGHGVPEMVTPAMRTTAVLLVFLNLTNMSCSVLPWQAAWQVILISSKSS